MRQVPNDRLAEILDIAEDGIVTVDAEYRIVLFNRGAMKIFGYSAEDVLGQSLDLLIPQRYHGTHRGQVESFAHGPVASRVMGERMTVVGRCKDGTEFPAEITISKLDGADGPLLTAIIRNAVERKRYENALLRLNHDLEERVKVRTAELAERNLQLTQKTEENELFVYSVSHDLRSPLVNLEGFSEELLASARDLEQLVADSRIPLELQKKAGELLGEGMQESIKFIRAAVGRLSRIIDALLKLSRAGRVVYTPHRVEVQAVVARIADALHGTLDKKRATLTIGELPPAWADPLAIDQVFANVLSNAVNYLDPARPGRIEIGALSPADDGRMQYFIRDNGLGIPASGMPKVFQAFQRLHPHATPGEGIGLAICRRVLERLGGTIRVDSVVNEGTVFTIILPAVV